MRTSVVRIGNSRGLRIPKAALAQCQVGDDVELEVRKGELFVRPVRAAREGWDEAFRSMADRGGDRLLAATAWDRSQWRW